MATTNVFLVISEPMFTQRATPTTASPLANNDPASDFGTNCSSRPGAIEVLEFEFEIKQVGTEEGGRPRSVERVERTDVTIKKAVDSRSPKLFRYCCEGTFIGLAELQVFGPVVSTPYLVYRMSYVHVAGYAPSGGVNLPTEQIKLRFGEMAVLFNNAGMGSSSQGNSRTGKVRGHWSWVTEIPFTIGNPVTTATRHVDGFEMPWGM